RPSAWTSAARSSAVASSGNIRSTGLPVSRPSRKTMVATAHTSTTPCMRRRAMNRFMVRWISLLPGLLVRTRNALEHVAELVPAGNGVELADLLLVDGVVAHALEDRHHGPGIGRQLDHVVGERRALGGIEFGQERAVGLHEVLAGVAAVVLVAQQALDAF